MNKQINFEDTIFILNVRLRMVRDLLRLDTDASLFLEKTLDDLEFTSRIIETLVEQIIANPRLLDRNQELDNLSDLAWQLGQTLSECAAAGSPFQAALFSQAGDRVQRLKEAIAAQKKAIDGIVANPDQSASEPVVSSAELNELLKGL
jgi:hypothetical protein